MEPSSEPVPTSAELQGQIGATRVKQVMRLALAAMAISGTGSAITGKWSDAAVLGVSTLAMIVGWWLANRGRTDAATTILLSTLVGMVSVMVWKNGGVH